MQTKKVQVITLAQNKTANHIYNNKQLMFIPSTTVVGPGFFIVDEEKTGCHFIESIPQHIYFVDDSPIQEDDYYITINDTLYNPPKHSIYCKSIGVNGNGKKIIASTDKLLELPLIPQSFIKYYAERNGNVGDIELAMELTSDSYKVYGEFQRPDDDYPEKTWYELKLNSNNEVSVIYNSLDNGIEEDIYDAVASYRNNHPEPTGKDEFVSASCIGEVCSVCKKNATKKLSEVIMWDDLVPNRHPFTNYVCNEHFDMVLRPYQSKSKEVETIEKAALKAIPPAISGVPGHTEDYNEDWRKVWKAGAEWYRDSH